jgi:acyl-CoA thioesterase FadM
MGRLRRGGNRFLPQLLLLVRLWLPASPQRSRSSQRILRERFGAVTPILRAEAEFVAPARYDDVLAIVAHIEQWEARQFRVTYTLSHDDRPVAKGYETRAWATVTHDGRLKGTAIAAEFRSLLES